MRTREDQELLIRALEEKAVSAAQEGFLQFIQYMNPLFVTSRHHEIIADRLEAVERGEIRRLIVCLPPRSGKSLMISEYLPAWWLGLHVTHQILAISYAGEQAKTWGKKVRDMIDTPEYHRVFRNTILSANTRAADRWETTEGGVYNSAGITSGVAGKGAHLGLIDDPLNEQDAYSKAAMDHVRRWWPAGFLSRLMPGGRVIILSTRWNEDDLVGFVEREARENPEQAQWEVLSIPALLDAPNAELLGYPEGTSYWPVNEAMVDKAQLSGWSTEEIKEKRASLPDYQWQALYMQRPSAIEGAIIKRDEWEVWPNFDPPKCQYVVLSCDTAFSTATSADFSALVVWGIFADPHKDAADIEPEDHHFIALASEKGRWDYPTLRKRVIEMYKEYEVDIILIEKKASGQSLIQDLYRTLLPVYSYNPDKDKVARAHAIAPAFAQGRVWIPDPKKFKWAEQLVDECARFSGTGASKDDLVDATTQAIIWVRDNLLLQYHEDAWEDEWREPDVIRRKAY